MQMYHVMLGCSLTALLVILHLPLISCDDVIVQKRIAIVFSTSPQKRPFCNAFTGCGKKRSDESMGTLVEMNSEPAVEELSRQILSEAKLWEAIQEARAELLRRRQEQSSQYGNAMDRSLPLPLAGYRRKRLAATETEANSNMPRSELQEQMRKPWNRNLISESSTVLF
ncbi:hypothetical protein L9F63_015525, partial [Diploptera punctata]